MEALMPHKLLEQYFGFTEFRPGQLEVIEALNEHKAALAVFPTGGGKSLCYQLPALAYAGVTAAVPPLPAFFTPPPPSFPCPASPPALFPPPNPAPGMPRLSKKSIW